MLSPLIGVSEGIFSVRHKIRSQISLFTAKQCISAQCIAEQVNSVAQY